MADEHLDLDQLERLLAEAEAATRAFKKHGNRCWGEMEFARQCLTKAAVNALPAPIAAARERDALKEAFRDR